MEQVTTIRADQWELVAEDVKAGRCEVINPLYDYVISHIEPIKPNSVGWAVAITDAESTYRTRSSVELTVRWLAPAPASEPKAGGAVYVYPSIDKQGYDILSGGKLDRWENDKGNAFEYALVLANDNIRALQTELAQARQQLAAAGAVISSAKNHLQGVVEYIDNPPRRMSATDVSMGMWSQAAAGLEDIEAYQAQATPQPATEASDGGQVGSLIVCETCDGTGKLFVPQTPPVTLPAIDSAGNSAPEADNLRAAVARVIALAPESEPTLPNIADDLDCAVHVAENANYVRSITYWYVKQILAAALKAGE